MIGTVRESEILYGGKEKTHFASPAAKVYDSRCCSDDWLSRDGVPACSDWLSRDGAVLQSVFASNGSTLPSW